MSTVRKPIFVAVLAAGALLFSGCTSESTEPAGETATTSSASAGTSLVVADDSWVKAADTADPDAEPTDADAGMNGHTGVMTPVFGTLRNESDSDLRLVGASAAVSDKAELHETVLGPSGAASMQKREGGFAIPAGETLVLEPGGNHIMLMGLRDPVTTGQQVTITLEFEDGNTTEMVVPGRSFEGGNEQYQGGE